jgi:hypothetical protein
MQRKQERTKRQRQAAAVIDLASQSSNELQSPSASLGMLLAGKERAFAVGDGLGLQPPSHLQVHTGRMHAVNIQSNIGLCSGQLSQLHVALQLAVDPPAAALYCCCSLQKLQKPQARQEQLQLGRNVSGMTCLAMTSQ